MPLSRDDYKQIIRITAEAGEGATVLVKEMRGQSLALDELRVLKVLKKVAWVGREARDVFDQMEENDAH